MNGMASLTFEGVIFSVFSNDHPPRHVHAQAAGVVVIINLRQDGMVEIAKRKRGQLAIKPGNAKKSEVKRALRMAALHFEALAELWERVHEKD
jgi:Domain of unknown function (DUF4160)